MRFFDPYQNKPPKEKSPSGEEIIDDYQVMTDARGKTNCKKMGKINIYERIQAQRDTVDIYKILEQCVVTGSEQPLQRVSGIFGDFTQVPTDLNTMNEHIQNAERIFNSIDKEIREKFNNNIGEFRAQIKTGEAYKKIGHMFKKPEIKQENTQGVNLNE